MSPRVSGPPIHVEFRPALRAHRGKLLSGSAPRGTEVHAGSFLRHRLIVLDATLKEHPRELARILTHEVFHFAWLRLGNLRRRSYEDLLRREIQSHVKGELGWSAESAKAALIRADSAGRWRKYVCESFCDSGPWLMAGQRRHAEVTP